METINLTINEKEKEIYDFFKHCKNDSHRKMVLRNIVDFYEFSNHECGILYGHLTPEKLRDNRLSNMSKEELNQLKKEYLNALVLFAQDYHPDEIDCGIMRGQDSDYWFIDDCSRIGFITLYANYIKKIDELLCLKRNCEK